MCVCLFARARALQYWQVVATVAKDWHEGKERERWEVLSSNLFHHLQTEIGSYSKTTTALQIASPLEAVWLCHLVRLGVLKT